MENKKYSAGEVIFKEGQWEMAMYDIVSGKVGIYAAYGTDGEQLLTELGAGKFFGEMGLVEFVTRSATAVALEDTETVYIDAKDMDEYFKNQPEKILAILKNLTGRLRELSSDYLDACHTISEYMEAEKEKAPKSKGLMAKIKKLVDFNDANAAIYNQILESDPSFLSYSNMFEWY